MDDSARSLQFTVHIFANTHTHTHTHSITYIEDFFNLESHMKVLIATPHSNTSCCREYYGTVERSLQLLFVLHT